MWYALIIFAIAILSLLGFLVYKLVMLRRNGFTTAPSSAQGFVPILMEDIHGRVEYMARTGVRITLLFFLKHTARTVHTLKQKTDRIAARAYAFAKHHEKRITDTHTAENNDFLEAIGEYKKKIVRPRKRSQPVDTSIS